MDRYTELIDRLDKLLETDKLIVSDDVIAQAEKLLAHQFNVLGSGWVHNYYGMQAAGFEGHNYTDPSISYAVIKDTVPSWYKTRQTHQLALLAHFVKDYEPIDWQIDIKSGGRYDIAHVRDIKFGTVEGLDAKMSADMSRGYQLVILARAWRATGQACFRNEVIGQILDWMTVNPPEYGAGWRANMNVAIRSVNWLAACSLISPGFDIKDPYDRAFLDLLYDSLLEHRRYICQFLEFTENPTALHPNHYVANLTGLLVLCSFLKPLDLEATPWETMAIRELSLTMRWQINRDGLDFEGTTMYHAFVLEMLSHALILAARMNDADDPASVHKWIKSRFGSAFDQILYRMFTGLRDLIQPNGQMPVVGDADSGRFLCLESHICQDTERVFLCAVGAALYQDMALLPQAFSDRDAITANTLFAGMNKLIKPQQSRPVSVSFPDTGFYIMKNENLSSFIICGPVGTDGMGSHAHNDRLQVLLHLKGEDIIIDPGVYTYTASRMYRDRYRDVGAHATVCIDDKQPNRLNPPGCWWGYLDDTRCACLAWESTPESTRFVGEHYGYQRLETPVTHRRSVTGDHDGLVIHDHFRKAKNFGNNMTVTYHFTLGPQCRATLEGQKVIITANDLLLSITTQAGIWSKSSSFFAPMYGAQAETTLLKIRFDTFVEENELTFAW